jgi:hypothetical protein
MTWRALIVSCGSRSICRHQSGWPARTHDELLAVASQSAQPQLCFVNRVSSESISARLRATAMALLI